MKNILQVAEYNRLLKTFGDGLTYYSQENCQISLTDRGYRIYRPANIESYWGYNHTTWGGLNIKPFDCDSNALIQGHSYCLMFDVEGQTSCSNSDTYWTGQIGWGGGGIEPTPTTISSNMILENNFNGKRQLHWAFTINDSIYKVCTENWDGGHVVGASYLSYRDFKWGFTYQNTGPLGTDLYISNIRLYDITNIPKQMLLKNGILNSGVITALCDSSELSLQKYGETRVSELIEY